MSEGSFETGDARLNEKVNRAATALIKIVVKPGDHVGLCAPNSSEGMVFYQGAPKAGAVAATLSSMLKWKERALLVGRLQALRRYNGSGRYSRIKCNVSRAVI